MDDLIYRGTAIIAVKCGSLSARTVYGRTDEGMAVLKDTLTAIKELPAVDAVEIIRCKDCKYCDKGIDEDGKPFLKCLGWVYGGTSETDFCSHAERRQDG